MAKRKSTIDQALGGETGILGVLKSEHETISALMVEIAEDSASIAKRSRLYADFRKRLILHAKGEELEFYTECRTDPHLRTMADESLDDHKEMEQLILELDRGPMQTQQWLEAFENLQHIIEEHVEFEENELFPRVEEYFDEDQLREMGAAYDERRDILEDRLDEIEPHERPSL